jgi:hypothetical protein
MIQNVLEGMLFLRCQMWGVMCPEYCKASMLCCLVRRTASPEDEGTTIPQHTGLLYIM